MNVDVAKARDRDFGDELREGVEVVFDVLPGILAEPCFTHGFE